MNDKYYNFISELCEMAKLSGKQELPKMAIDPTTDLSKLTEANLRSLIQKQRRFLAYAKKHEDKEGARHCIDQIRRYATELISRGVNVSGIPLDPNKEVSEGYGAGDPNKDPLIPKGKRWTVKFK